MSNLLELIQRRHSIYHLGANTDVTIEDVTKRLEEIAVRLPSAMHSQTTRMVVISGEANDKVWDIIDSAQKNVMDENTYAVMSGVFANAKEALGTILFFESRDAVAKLPTSEHRALAYKENNHAIATYAAWLAITEMGLGASLQHVNVGYEQGFDKEIREYLQLPDDFELLAQMPVGSIETPATTKESIPASELVRAIS